MNRHFHLKNLRLGLVVPLVAASLSTARAVDYSWNTTSGSWSLNTNWSPNSAVGGPSGVGTYVSFSRNIPSTGTVSVFNTGDAGSATKVLGQLDVGDTNNSDRYLIIAGTGNGVLNFDNGASNAVINALVGSHGDSIAAPITLSSSLDIVNSATGAGAVLTISGSISAATAGTKTISINGGAVTFSATAGTISNGAGVVALAITNSSTVSLTGAHSYSGGTYLQNGLLTLASTAPVVTSGTLTSGVLGTGTVRLGSVSGTARLQSISTASVTLANDISLEGDLAIGSGTTAGGGIVTFSGTTAGKSVTLARTNTITNLSNFTINGAIVDGGNGFGLTKIGTGTMTLGSGESTANTYTGLTTLGEGNTVLNKASGVNAIAGDILVNGTGTLTLSGSNNENIANTSNVTVNTGGSFNLNGRTETVGSVTVGGGLISGSGTLAVAGAGSATVNSGTIASTLVSGGGGVSLGSTASVSGAVSLNGNVAFTGSTAGATITSTVVALNGSRTFTVASGTGAVDLSISSTITNGSVSGSGLTKQGTGVLALNGASTYTGTTAVNVGTLLVNGSLAAGSAVSVASGATIGGAGTVNGTLVVNGNLDPGAVGGTGILTASNAAGISFATGSTITLQLNGTTLGTSYDQLSTNGISIASNSNIVLTIGYAAQIGDSFTLVDNTSAAAFSGVFANLSQGGTITSGIYTLQGTYLGGTGNDLVVTVTAVPEPGSCVLLGVGASVLLWRLRRKSAA